MLDIRVLHKGWSVSCEAPIHSNYIFQTCTDKDKGTFLEQHLGFDFKPMFDILVEKYNAHIFSPNPKYPQSQAIKFNALEDAVKAKEFIGSYILARRLRSC